MKSLRSRHLLLIATPFAALCFVGIPITGFSQTIAQNSLPLPSQQQSFPGAFATGRVFPVIANGYLLSFNRTITPGKSGSIYLTALANGQQATVPLQIPGAAKIRIESGTVSTDGTIVVAGSYGLSANSTSDVNFIAKLGLSGSMAGVFNLLDYTPERVCSESDGSIWTLGQVWADEDSGNSGYSLLRHYNSSGALVAQYFPRSLMPMQPKVNYHARVAGRNYAFLECGASSVAAYVGKGTAGFLWFEVDLNSGTTFAWTVAAPVGGVINGIVLLSEHTAFASVNTGGLYRLTAGASGATTWTPVPITVPAASGGTTTIFSGANAISTLLGHDGTNLSYLKGPLTPIVGQSDPQGDTTIYWSAGPAN